MRKRLPATRYHDMTLAFRIWRLVPITAVGLYIIYDQISSADTESIFDGFSILGLSLLFIFVFLYNFYIDRKEHQISKQFGSYVPTIAGLLFLVAFGLTQYIINKRDDSKILLQANNDGGFNGCGFEFRENGTYKFFNGSGLGVKYSRGEYSLRDSIIILDKTQIDNVIKSNRLVIRKIVTESFDSKILYQTDSNNSAIDGQINFIVNIDNRPPK